jgi:hypothetical protein
MAYVPREKVLTVNLSLDNVLLGGILERGQGGTKGKSSRSSTLLRRDSSDAEGYRKREEECSVTKRHLRGMIGGERENESGGAELQ